MGSLPYHVRIKQASLRTEDLHQPLFFFLLLLSSHFGFRHLRVAPIVQNSDLVHTLNGTGWRTPFFGLVLAFEIFHRVLFERNSRKAALLRAPVNFAVFANVQITRT